MNNTDIQSLLSLVSSLDMAVGGSVGESSALERSWINPDKAITAEGHAVLVTLGDAGSTRTVFRNY